MTKDITSNLIINYLPQFMTDEEFKNMFLSIGPLKSFKIVRDKSTGFSYGFGFADYESERDAERAIKTFDGLHLYSKRIRVQHANKNDELHKGYNIYVKNIPSEFRESELDKLFEPFGKILTSKVLMDLNTGQSKNVGFVLYESKAEADKAIGELNGKSPPGCSTTLYLKFADDASKKALKSPQPMLPHISPQQSFTPPFPSPIPQNNGFAPPSNLGPVRNQATGNRFRFNPLARDANANNNFNNNNNNNNNNSNFGGGNMNYGAPSPTSMGLQSPGPVASGMTSPKMDLPQGPGPYSIFVYNIGDDAEERELWALFSPFGTVQKCTVMMDQEKKVCKGFGFVDMSNAIEAANAIKSLNGYFYKGRQLNVSFKKKKEQ